MEAPGFEPLTLNMPKTPMRYDNLDRSTTTARLLSLVGACAKTRLAVNLTVHKQYNLLI